jgi:hypothetical protein
MDPIYSPKKPRKNICTPPKKNTATIIVVIPGAAIRPRIRFMVNWIKVYKKLKADIHKPTNIPMRVGTLLNDINPFNP